MLQTGAYVIVLAPLQTLLCVFPIAFWLQDCQL